MKPTLQLRVSQQLTMTPQLQQAIRLLQLSSLELQNEIQEALDANPLLELQPEHDSDANEPHQNSESEQNDTKSNSEQNNQDEHNDNNNSGESSGDESSIETTSEQSDISNDIPDELVVDTNWDDIYPTQSTSHSSASSESDFNFDDRNATEETLVDQLLWQLNLTPMSDLDKTIAATIIESLDYNGYLSAPLEDIRDTVLKDPDALPPGETLEIDEIQAVLSRVQRFDPPGIAARNLQECLLLQLEQLPTDHPHLERSFELVRNHLQLMGNRDYAQLQRKLRVSEDILKDIIKTLQTLNPYPGASLQGNQTEYVVPDVIVTKKSGQWHVDLNPDVSPKLRINSGYAALAKTATSSSDANYIKSNLQEARWFIKSLISRNETLLKVAKKIVEHQIAFFEYGEEAMKPLVLHEIAEAVEMHESTISRVTTQKFMHTPMGIFELKYFFSSHVSTTAGGECSSKAIQALIKKLVAAENKRKPLSDNQIAKLLVEKGIQVARRTIAKYRESLNIPPSNERKQLV